MRRRDLMAGAVATSFASIARAEPHPVVLELFTSQGCSSCPPADALLGQLAKRPNVIALAWHIDYWNHLGWRDPFASRAATARQQAYARQIGSDVFTPALVLDGGKMLIGSNRAVIDAAIAAAGPLPIPVTLTRSAAGVLVDLGATAAPVRVQRIVYDPQRATDVGAGENDGAHLREFRIVRELETLVDGETNPRRLVAAAPAPGQGQVILVQSGDLRVLGAADLPPA